MNIFRIKVDLVFFDWDELQTHVGKILIMYNRCKPWNGFTEVIINDINNNYARITATKSTAFNKFGFRKDEYEKDYFITDNLMWHRLSENTKELDYKGIN